MSNEDVLIGRMTDAKVGVETDFGPASFEPTNLSAVAFDARNPGSVGVTLWDGSSLRGKLAKATVGFAIEPDGPKLELDAAHTLSIASSMPCRPRTSWTRSSGSSRSLGLMFSPTGRRPARNSFAWETQPCRC